MIGQNVIDFIGSTYKRISHIDTINDNVISLVPNMEDAKTFVNLV